MTAYVTQFRTAADLAAELLTETGVTVPAHRGDGSLSVWHRERRYNIDSVGQQISENARRQIESMAMRDLTECGRLTRNALQKAAAELAVDLFNDWCAETEAERAVGMSYVDESDEYGSHSCCGALSYNPHRAGCRAINERAKAGG